MIRLHVTAFRHAFGGSSAENERIAPLQSDPSSKIEFPMANSDAHDEDEEVLQTDWFRVGDYDYAVIVVPEALPRWVPQVGTGGGLGGAILANIFLVRNDRAPYLTTIVRTKGLINFRWVRVYEESFESVAEANTRGRALEADLRGGVLPRSNK